MTALELLDDYAHEPQHAYAGHRRDHSAPKAFAALRVVLARHSDDGDGNCTECLRCRPGRDLAVAVPFPCATARDIARELESP